MIMSVRAQAAPHTDTDSLSVEVEIASTRMENKIVEKPPKLLYIEVTDAEETKSKCSGGQRPSFRYTRSLLQSTLQLMGCKPRHAFKISKHVIDILRYQSSSKEHSSKDQYGTQNVSSGGADNIVGSFIKEHANCSSGKDRDDDNENKPFEVYKRQTTLTVGREVFLDVICDALSEYKYVGPNQRADLILACRIREHKDSVTILLCGTSGCGKSTLSALLASRLGITTVVSTDSIRHMMRGFTSEEESPLLFASTYHAGECLDPISVAVAKAKKKSKKLSRNFEDSSSAKTQANESLQSSKGAENNNGLDIIGPKALAVEGYKAQSEMVIDSLDRLITSWEEKKESVVIEGVHLSLSFVMGLMKKHPSIIPFMIYIASEEKHLERFAVRAKYMTLDPAKNKYVKYIRNIRAIQDYLCKRADKHLVPKVNNTNVDKSVAAIHATVFSCLRRRNGGEQLYDSATNTVSVVEEEYRSQCTSYSITSKGMLQLIQRKGSHPHLMALVNIDGSLAKAWPYESDNSANKYSVEKDLVKAELVNLQFGNFGLGSWAADIGGTSHANSIDGSRIDSNDTSSHYYSSCSSTPRFSDGRSTKEQAEDDDNILQYSTEEEPDEIPDVDSDEDLKGNKEDEMEGSVDEGSERSDDEYDEDMAIDEEEDRAYYSDSPGKENVVSNVLNSVKCHSLGLPPHDSRVENYYQNAGSRCLDLEPQLVSYAHFKELSNNCSI